MKQKFKKTVAWLLTLAMLVAMLPGFTLTAHAASWTPLLDTSIKEICAMATPIYIEAGTAAGCTVVYYYNGGTKTYVTQNDDAGMDLSGYTVYGGSGWNYSSDSYLGLGTASITMTGGNLGALVCGSRTAYYSCDSVVNVTGGAIGSIYFGSENPNSNGDYRGTTSGIITVAAGYLNGTGRFTSGIYKDGSTYVLRESYELSSTLTIAEGETLTVESGNILTNNGTIINNGTMILYNQIKGNAITGNGTIDRRAPYIAGVSSVSSLTVKVDGDTYDLDDDAYELADGNLYIWGLPSGDAEIVLNGSKYYGEVESGSRVQLIDVSDIVGIPAEIGANRSVALSATAVSESNEEFTFAQNVIYEIVSSGTTALGVTLTGNTLYAASGGDVLLKMTAVNDSGDPCYYIEFDINVVYSAISEIGELQNAAYVNQEIRLPSVSPSDASYSDILWSVESGSATISGGVLTPTAEGDLVIRASVENGKIYGETYEKLYSLKVQSVENVGLDISLGDIVIKEESDTQLRVSYTLFDNGYKIIDKSEYIPIRGETTQYSVTVESGDAHIYLSDCSISVSKNPISISSGAVLHLTLNGTNRLVSTNYSYAGLGVPSGATLYIGGSGSLNASGGSQDPPLAAGSAGIGGNYRGSVGTIVIEGGIVNASGGRCSAGIGGAQSDGGTVVISGGLVTSTGGINGAGIGGGYYGSGGTITISGGTIIADRIASLAGAGAGIGAGFEGSGGSIVITGGNIRSNGITGTPVDADGCSLTLRTLTLNELTSQEDVTVVNGVEYYGCKDVRTLDTNKLYFYLPAGSVVTSVTAGGVNYICNRDNTLYTGHGETRPASCSMGVHCGLCGVELTDPLGHSFENDICTRCGIRADGLFHISTPEQLVAFGTAVNSGNNTANAILEADIDMTGVSWTTICETGLYYSAYGADLGYAGTFDGNGHVIENLTVKSSTSMDASCGLFGTVSGTIKNLGVEGFTFVDGGYDIRAGAIVGQLITTSGLVENCYVVNATITPGEHVTGGVAGCVYEGTVRNCHVYKSSINGSGNRYGYIVGDSRGDVSNTDRKGTVVNCFSDDATLYSSRSGNISNVAQKDASAFTSGEVAYLLNGSSSEGVWKQTIWTDAYPNFAGETVYSVTLCNGEGYANTSANITEHNYDEKTRMCSNCGDVAGGIYKIYTAENFVQFATLVNGGRNKLNGQLMADIDMTDVDWTLIGSNGNRYNGTFNGNGYTLTYSLSGNNEVAPFAYSENATIKNLVLKGSITASGQYAGSVASKVYGTTILKNIISYVNIQGTNGGDGTHGGLVGVAESNSTLNITNCGYAGTMSGSSHSSAGFIGWNNATTAITASFVAATFSMGTSASNTFARNPGNVTLNNCYYLNAFNETPGGATQVTAAQFANGEVAYKLNGDQTEIVWKQTIWTDPLPNFTGETVYNITLCNSSTGYANTNENITDHNYDEKTGLCANCGEVKNNTYYIYTAENLVQFASLVNSGKKNLNGELMADIDMTGVSWTVIAQTASYHTSGSSVTDGGYTGTFDGNYHVISNLSVKGGDSGILSYGLFGTLSGTVENLGMNGYSFTVGIADCRAGGIAGQVVTGGTISDCYIVNSSVLTGTKIGGGIAGCNYGGTIQNCHAYNCTVTGYQTRWGNIVGDCKDDGGNKAGTVTNCYSDGTRVVSTQNTEGNITSCEAGVSADRFASGEIAYKLNGDQSTIVWKQTLGGNGDAYPNFTGDTVYKNSADNTYNNHVHKWTYTGSSDTITASCDATGCTVQTMTVQISKPTLTVYGETGNADATLSAETVGDYDNLSNSIQYWKGDTQLTSAPTDAGDYKASITVGNATASVTYTIAKAQATVPTGLTAVYGQTLKNVSLSEYPGWTWANSDASVGDVGERKHKANYAGTDNYEAVNDVELTVTVSQSGATMSANTENNIKEYTYGDTVTIIVSGITSTGAAPTSNTYSLKAPTTNQVAIWNGDTQLTEPQTVTGSELTFTVTGLEVGNYTLTAKFTGNDNMAATSATVSFNVKKAEQEAFSITGQPTGEIAYGNNFTLGTSGGTGDGTVTWTATGTSSVDAYGKVSICGVGAFSITATKAGGTNYEDATATYAGTSVKATPDIGNVTYSGGTLYDSTDISTVELTRSNTTVQGALELTDSELTAGTKTYNWEFIPNDSTNYKEITGKIELTVTADIPEKLEVTVTLMKTQYVYGEEFSLDGLTVTATYTSGATKDVTNEVTYNKALSVGQTSVELTYGSRSCTIEGITVSKKQLDVSDMSWSVPTGTDAVYSGSAKTATLNGTLPEGVTVTKTGDTGTNVGDYTAAATFSLANGYTADNYEIIGANPLTANWAITVKTVAEADIGISGVNASYTYTGSAIYSVVSVVVNGKTLTKGTDYTVSYGANTDVSTGGSVTVTLKGNYSGTKSVTFAILASGQAAFSISGANSATYGDSAITLTANGGSGDGAITWTIASGNEFAEISGNGQTATLTIKGAGTVVVNAVKAASTDGNYGATDAAIHSITINKATVSANNFSYTAPSDLAYSKTAKAATVTGDEAYGAITIKYYSDSSLTNVVDPINVGTYYVGITTAGGANYEPLAKTLVGSFEITPKKINVTAKAQTRQYNQDNPTLTYDADALFAGDSFTGALATNAAKTSDVGEYAITQGTLSAGDNYKIFFIGAKLTIIQANGPDAPAVTGTSTNDGITYTYTVDVIEGAEYSWDGTTWQDSNVFSGLVAGQKYTFYARIKETKNVKAGEIGKSAEVDLSKLPGKGTVKIDGWTYGETAKTPVVESSTGNSVASYLYESTDGKGYSSATVPTNAGEYKLTVTFAATATHNGTTASAEFTIAKATPVVSAPTGLTATYGDMLATIALPDGWAWKDATTTEVGNAGENTFTVIYTKDNSGNYNTVEKTVTITVSSKEVCAPTIEILGNSFIFDGSEHRPGVTVKDSENTISASEYTVEYADNTNAGTANITIKDNDGGNYTVSGTTTFKIEKKASAALPGVEREFMRTIATTGNEINVATMLPDNRGTTTYTITSDGYTVLENVSVDADGKLVFDTKTSAAAATDTITVKVEMQNYTDATLTVSVILNEKTPQNITGVTAAEELIYNGNAQQGYTGTPTSEQYTGTYEITYTGRDNSYNSSVAPTNAGDYTVTFKIPDTDLYYSGNVSINFSIGKAKATVTADDKEAYIGSRMPELTYKVVGLIGDDTISVELSCDANMNRVGETPIVVTATDPNGNYEITTVNGTLTVKYYPYIPAPTYPPVVDSGDNGDVTVSPKNPEKGDTVIITPDPDAGYEVDEIVVTDKNGNPVEVIDNGDGTYSFKQPSGKVNIEVTFKKIVETCPGDSTCPMYGYTDLDMTAWYHDGVHFCIENKLMQGISTTAFAPGTSLSRAMLVTILWRLEGNPVVNYAMDFEDVDVDKWYTEAIRWAASERIVEGYGNGKFGTNDDITREQLAAILYRYEQKNGGGFKGMWMFRMDYVDLADVSVWAYEAMCWMNMNSIVNGKPGKVLDPKGSATRAEAAAMIQRYSDVMTNED